jgi:hypothetical protein
VAADAVSSTLSDKKSLIQTIESLSAASGRRLEKLEYAYSLPVDAASLVPDHELLDPETPIEFDRMVDRFVSDDNGQATIRPVIKIASVLLVLFALAAAWRWSPLSEWMNAENLAATFTRLI